MVELKKGQMWTSAAHCNEFTNPDLLTYNENTDKIKTFRSARGHYKLYDPKFNDGVLERFDVAEVHFNRIPSMGLGNLSLKSPLGYLSAGFHCLIDGNEHLPIMWPRNQAVLLFETAHNYGVHYNAYLLQ